jgi:hypothetical protein
VVDYTVEELEQELIDLQLGLRTSVMELMEP